MARHSANAGEAVVSHGVEAPLPAPIPANRQAGFGKQIPGSR